MACTNPIFVYRPDLRKCDNDYFREVTGWTKSTIPVDVKEQYGRYVPCGKCEDCLHRKKNDYYVRCNAEYERCTNLGGVTLFCTFTFDQDNIPIWQGQYSFNKNLVQEWIAKMQVYVFRKFSMRLKYFIVSELGGLTHRPHHHAILFFYPTNADGEIVDRYTSTSHTYTKTALVIDISKYMENAWSYGMSELKPVTSAGAIQYITNYVSKDVVNDTLFQRWRIYNEKQIRFAESRYYDKAHMHHSLSLDALSLALERTSRMRLLVRRIHHRYSQFTMISQGIGCWFENEIPTDAFVQNKPIWVTGFAYAVPRYYVDRANRAYLKFCMPDRLSNHVDECTFKFGLTEVSAPSHDFKRKERAKYDTRFGEMPCSIAVDESSEFPNEWYMKISRARELYMLNNTPEVIKHQIALLPPDLRTMYYDNLPEDDMLSEADQLRLVGICVRAASARKSAQRIAQKKKNEEKKVQQKVQLSLRSAYHIATKEEIEQHIKSRMLRNLTTSR